MHIFYHYPIIFLLLLLSCTYAHGAQFAAVSNKKAVDLAEVVRNVEETDVIFIGEVHNGTEHHRAQLDVIRSLHAKKIPIAIGLEMFTTDDQQKLDDWTAGKLDEESFTSVYSRNWSYEWQLYRDLLIFARNNRIPLIALNIPKPVISKIMKHGSGALLENEVPPNISWSLNQSQAEYLRNVSRQVFGAPADKLASRISEAQALRNSGMAWNIVKYRQKHETEKVVVLAGTWHAVKNGVPELLSTYGRLGYKVILPELPELNLENTTVKEADYLIMRQELK